MMDHSYRKATPCVEGKLQGEGAAERLGSKGQGEVLLVLLAVVHLTVPAGYRISNDQRHRTFH